MITYLVDTNVFLRFILKDNPLQHKKAEAYFRDAKNGDVRLVFLPDVIEEIVYVLQKVYRMERDTTAAYVSSLIKTPGVEVEEPDIFLSALSWYSKYAVDFTDAVIFETSRKRNIEIATFDEDFKKFIRSSS